MAILKELSVAAGKYTDSSGTEKTRWKTIGHIHEGQKGQYITLDPMVNLAAIPKKEGDDRIYVNMFDPKPKDGQRTPQKAPAATRQDDPDQEIPF